MDSRKFSDWAELLASAAVVIGLVILIQEIKVNTQAIERQAGVDRATVLSDPFFQSAEIRAASEKIRAVDGRGPIESAFIERYDMTPDEALVWARHNYQLWNVIESDYYYGNPETAKRWVSNLLRNPDQRVYIEHQSFTGDFGQMIREVAAQSDQLQ